MEQVIVRQGDCLSSIAHRYGFFWETLWNHPSNAQLKQLRKDPNVLHPGDVLVIPDKQVREEPAGTDQSHRYMLKSSSTKLRLVIKDGDQPRANAEYELHIDGTVLKGKTDGNGVLEQPIPSHASTGVLLFENDTPISLALGHLDPIETISGVQARLLNLGFDCGAIDGQAGPLLEEALKQFQEAYQLSITGQVDDATQSKLLSLHGA